MIFTKKKIGVAVAAVALVAAGAALAKGDEYYHHGERGFGGHFGFGKVDRVARVLDLSDDQREQTRALMNSIREFHRGHLEKARLEIAATFTQESLSPAEAQELLSLRERRRAEGRAFMGGKLSEFHALLTPAQRERAVALLDKSRGPFARFGRGKSHDRWDWDDDDDDDHHRRHRDRD